MYAVFNISGFQYSVVEGEVLQIPLQDAKEGDKIDIEEVLLIKGEGDAVVGNPYIENAKIEAEVVKHGKADKVLIYKYKRRTKYRRSQGHRQDFSEVKINKIVTP
jgi:large subunit ribosomal protein L21